MEKRIITIYTVNDAMPGYLHIPDNVDVNHPAPVIVFNNGYTAYKEMYDDMAEAFCNAGYITLQYDNRGTAGSRHGFQLCGTEWKEDAHYAISYAYGCPEVDRNRIALAGVSMGGAITLMQGAVDSRIKCLYAMAPYLNGYLNDELPIRDNLGDVAWNDYLARMFEDAAMVAHGFSSKKENVDMDPCTGKYSEPDDQEKEARKKHPLKITELPLESTLNTYMYVDALSCANRIKVPTLVVHGTADKTLDYKNSFMLFDELQCIKEFHLIEGAGHILPEVATKQCVEYGLKWFEQYL